MHVRCFLTPVRPSPVLTHCLVENGSSRALPLVAFLVAMGFVLAPAHAAQETAHSEPVAFETWLESPIVAQGEPVVLRYRATNRNGSVVALNLLNEECWLRMDLTDAGGRPVPTRGSVFAPRAGSVPRTCSDLTPVLPSGGRHQDGLVVTRRFADLAPGNYCLQLKISIAYGAGGRPVAGTLQTRRRLDFTVEPLDLDRLRRTASALLARAATGEPRERGVAVEALLSMPADAARPDWRDLMRLGPEDSVRHAVDELVRLNSSEAAALLAKVAWDARRPAGLRARGRAGLLNVWWNGSAAARACVESAFTRHEGSMPETTSPPVLM